MGKKFLEDPDKLFELTKTMRIKDISILYGVSNYRIVNRIKDKYKTFNGCIKYNADYLYFNKIDTEEKAYWLGFLYADGNVNDLPGKKLMIVNLAIKDELHLIKFKNSLKSSHPLYYYEGERLNKKHKGCSLHICNLNLVSSLINLGCIPRKTWTLEFPSERQVPKELLRHFIRGYFDGDGSISFDDNYGNLHLNFTSTHNFLFKLRLHLFTHLNLPSYPIRTTGLGKISNIQYTGKQTCLNLLDYMYKDSIIYLDRKYEKYLSIRENLINYTLSKGCIFNGCKNILYGRHNVCRKHHIQMKLKGI